MWCDGARRYKREKEDTSGESVRDIRYAGEELPEDGR